MLAGWWLAESGIQSSTNLKYFFSPFPPPTAPILLLNTQNGNAKPQLPHKLFQYRFNNIFANDISNGIGWILFYFFRLCFRRGVTPLVQILCYLLFLSLKLKRKFHKLWWLFYWSPHAYISLSSRSQLHNNSFLSRTKRQMCACVFLWIVSAPKTFFLQFLF